ncbi:hypothetical protein EYF80_058910 [Liparis tanakae]|uniref:Uncharacterized protein n=1 Tax=Liparis tanakae TaxID=230148 RepID=A0A4Z2EPR6_9TELE|nr:hypothetical protein EYF80_058910 [Liparis tanakae]
MKDLRVVGATSRIRTETDIRDLRGYVLADPDGADLIRVARGSGLDNSDTDQEGESDTSLAGAQPGGPDVDLPPRALGRESVPRPRWIPEETRHQTRAGPDRQVTWGTVAAQDQPGRAVGSMHSDYYDLLTLANTKQGGKRGQRGRPNKIEWGQGHSRDPSPQPGPRRPGTKAPPQERQQTWNPPTSRSAAQGNPEAQQSKIIETLGWGDMMDLQDGANPGRPDTGRFYAPWGPLPEREGQVAQAWEIPPARAAPGARRAQRHPPAEDTEATQPAAVRTRPGGPPQGRPTGPLCDPGHNHGPIIAAHEAHSASDRAEIIRLLTALGESKAVIHRLQVKLDVESRAALLRQIEVRSKEEELEDLRCRYRALSASDSSVPQSSAEGPGPLSSAPVPPQDEAAWLIVVQFLVKLIDRLIADGYRKGGSKVRVKTLKLDLARESACALAPGLPAQGSVGDMLTLIQDWAGGNSYAHSVVALTGA